MQHSAEGPQGTYFERTGLRVGHLVQQGALKRPGREVGGGVQVDVLRQLQLDRVAPRAEVAGRAARLGALAHPVEAPAPGQHPATVRLHLLRASSIVSPCSSTTSSASRVP